MIAGACWKASGRPAGLRGIEPKHPTHRTFYPVTRQAPRHQRSSPDRPSSLRVAVQIPLSGGARGDPGSLLAPGAPDLSLPMGRRGCYSPAAAPCLSLLECAHEPQTLNAKNPLPPAPRAGMTDQTGASAQAIEPSTPWLAGALTREHHPWGGERGTSGPARGRDAWRRRPSEAARGHRC